MAESTWVKISEFPFYEVSNDGRIRTIQHTIIRKNGASFTVRAKELIGSNNGRGYIRVCLSSNGIKTREYVHRLVAIAFVENPHKAPFINHKDNNPTNNNAENLEWCTHEENMAWMRKQGRDKRTKEWLNKLHLSQEKSYKPVTATSITTGEVKKFISVNATKSYGFCPSCVCQCCSGIHNSHAGYRWEYSKR